MKTRMRVAFVCKKQHFVPFFRWFCFVFILKNWICHNSPMSQRVHDPAGSEHVCFRAQTERTRERKAQATRTKGQKDKRRSRRSADLPRGSFMSVVERNSFLWNATNTQTNRKGRRGEKKPSWPQEVFNKKWNKLVAEVSRMMPDRNITACHDNNNTYIKSWWRISRPIRGPGSAPPGLELEGRICQYVQRDTRRELTDENEDEGRGRI